VVLAGIAFGDPVYDATDGIPRRLLTLAALAAAAYAMVLARETHTRLGRTERRFNRVLEHLPLVAYVDEANATSSSLYASPQIERLLGYPEQEWLDDPALFVKLLHPDDADRVLAEHANTRATEEPLDTTYRLIAKNGDIVWVEDHGVIVKERGRRTLQGFIFDVTGQQRALEALRQSEERYRLIVESAGEGIWVIDRNAVTVFANARVAEMLHCTRDDVVGRSVFEFMDEEAAAAARDSLERRWELGTAEKYPFRYRRKDGTDLHVLLAANPLRDGDGNVVGALALVTDLTELRKHAEELAAREEKFHALFEGGTDAKLLADDDRRYVDANTAAERLLGRSREEILSLRVDDVFPGAQEETEATWSEFLVSGEQAGEFVLETPSGPRWVDYRANANIQPGLHLSLLRDVTAARAAEDELRMLASIVAEARDAVISTDTTGTIQSWHGAAECIYGYTREEAIGQPISMLVPPQSQELAVIVAQRLQRGEVIDGYEHQALRKDGRRVDVSMTLCPLRDRDGNITGVGGIVRDVTERKRLEEELRHAQRMEAIGQLAGGVAHDFNNSLMAIRGYASLMLTKFDDDDPRRRQAEGIVRAADSAAGVTRQLLAFGRKQMLQPRVLDVNDVVVDVHGLLERVIGEDIELAVELESTGNVRADPVQLEQVLVNLTVNGRDAIPNGGRLTIATDDVTFDSPGHRRSFTLTPGHYVRLTVTDTGLGMPPEVRDRVFDPFFTTKNVGSGTGLGLSTVYGIVKQSGGYIDVESEPGVGTTFEILLPATDVPVEARANGASNGSAMEGTECVLLVEDEPILRDLVAAMLEQLGYAVVTAADGAEAIGLLKNDDLRVDLLLTDVVMPGMSGTELAMRATLVRPRTKLLYMSGYTDEKLLHHGARNANVGFLQKPFSADELGRKLREVLMSRNGSAERSLV
jgi:two-component system cell cycle sensor histidine kinase/response regulator CckA